MSVIEVKNVKREYRNGTTKTTAINKISFTIEEGEFVVVLGPSGAGKSTLLNVLGGMDYVTEGDILVNGSNIAKYNDKKLTEYRAKNVGFVFQFYNLIPSLTAAENVKITNSIVKNALDAKEVLRLVKMEEHADKFPSQLSGGEQQRVSIARAVAKNPTMLLCDEPTGALDSETGILVLELLYRMSREFHKPVIVVTHNAVLADCADKVIHIRNGMITNVITNENPISIAEVTY